MAIRIASSRHAGTVGLAWLAMVGVDFVLHAGLLAPLYNWDSPFLLPPAEAFVRIPVGYLSFLVVAGALVWLLARLHVRSGRDAAATAAGAGAIGWGALLLGLWSISTADPQLLLGWWLGQTAELAVGGYVVGAKWAGVRTRTLAARIATLLVLGVVSVIVLQLVGYASPPVIVR